VKPRDGAERQAREPRGAARERVGRAELGVHEGQQDDDHPGQHPRDQRRPARGFRGGERPSSQPEPMIEPSEMNINDVRPTLRRRPLGAPFTSDTHAPPKRSRLNRPAMLRAAATPAIG